MHTVDLLDESLRMARNLGYEVRFEWLGGTAGGACEIHGRRWIFLDLALTPAEHLQLVREALGASALCLEARPNAPQLQNSPSAGQAA
ncbi:MAG: hypothetical protein HYS13_08150 [Planctomycetia bacterium]|nr:hypothetical protein [Planctomycetia bacterium]